jgi:trigger factor
MAPNDPPQSDDVLQTADDSALDDDQAADEEAGEEATKLSLEVDVQHRGACERHVALSVSREDVDRYFDKEYTELVKSADVPGFRHGHAPRKLIESRFRKDVGDRVKRLLVTDAVSQAIEDEKLSAISEADIDIEAVTIPDSGAFPFEFDIEVRPDFTVPQWKGLLIERPVREFNDRDIQSQMQKLLARYGRLVPRDGPAEKGDYLTVNLTFKDGEAVLSRAEEEVIRVRPVLSFRDGKITNFGELMEGVAIGETRQGTAVLSDDAPNAALRGREVAAIFEVLEVKRLETPEMTPEFLKSLGGFESEADLRDVIEDNLKRRLEYEQHRRARDQIAAALTEAADWDLPSELLARQSRRELERAVIELRRSGFSEDEIRAHENEIRQNSRASTARALKEHFILERIAEDEGIEIEDQDYDAEIALIAAQSSESPRRVRARMEKRGLMDALANEITERKVVGRILAAATFKEVPYELETDEAEAIDQTAGGHEESDIPEAKPEHEEKSESSEAKPETEETAETEPEEQS